MTNLVSSLPAPNSPEAVGWVILVAVGIITGLLTIANQGWSFFSRMFRIKPEPSETYVTKDVCRATMDGQSERIRRLEEDVRGIKQELQGMRKDLQDGLMRISNEAEMRASRLHKRIDPILEKLGHDRSTD